jgi:hypothetical protein
LPRSPLIRFQNASSSPEHRPATLVTSLPSYHSGVHSTFGDFSRQPPRRPNRTFRHQTNSFSFDDSVRASAAYEQDRISSTSTTDSIPRRTEQVSLQEELRRCSLGSGEVHAGEFSFAKGVSEEHQGIVQESKCKKEHIFPSIELPLPPPFSTVSRRASTAGSLPSLPDQGSRNPSAGAASRSPPSQLMQRIDSPSIVRHTTVESADKAALSLTVSSTPVKVAEC